MLPQSRNRQHVGNSQQPFSLPGVDPKFTSSNMHMPTNARHRVPISHFAPVNSRPLQESQNPNPPVGTEPTINPMLLQGNNNQPTANSHQTDTVLPRTFGQDIRNGLFTDPSLLPIFDQSAGIPGSAYHSGFSQPTVHNSFHMQATLSQQGYPPGTIHPGYGQWSAIPNGTNPALGSGGADQFDPGFASPTPGQFVPLGQQSINVEPAMVNRGRPRQHGRASTSPGERWTKEMDERLLTLKDEKMSHREITKVLKTEFPLFDHLNENIVSKRLATLREAAADPTKLQLSINRLIPVAIPLVANEFRKLAAEHGHEHAEGEKEEIELEMRAWCKAMFQRRILSRRRAAQGLGMSPAESQQ